MGSLDNKPIMLKVDGSHLHTWQPLDGMHAATRVLCLVCTGCIWLLLLSACVAASTHGVAYVACSIQPAAKINNCVVLVLLG